MERLSRDAVTTEDSHHVQQTAARLQQVVYMIRRTQSIIECNAWDLGAADTFNVRARRWWLGLDTFFSNEDKLFLICSV